MMAESCADMELLNADFDGKLIKIRNQFCQPPGVACTLLKPSWLRKKSVLGSDWSDHDAKLPIVVEISAGFGQL